LTSTSAPSNAICSILRSKATIGVTTSPKETRLAASATGRSGEYLQNPASSGSELAQLLLSFGVKKLVYPKVSSKEMLAFQALGLEVIKREFSSLEEAIYGLFG
jgi:hypothetical protein